MTSNKEKNQHTGSIILFFGLAYLLSWIFWIPSMLLDQEKWMPLVVMLYYIGGFGPTVAGILMIGRTQDKGSQHDFLHRLIGFKQIRPIWYAIIFLVFPILAVLTILTYRLFQGSMPSLPTLEGLINQPSQLIGLPFTALLILLVGPLSEEIGWRGFALDRLQARWNPLVTSLILGSLWALWHLPLFFIQGTMYADWGFGTGLFWLFIVRMIAVALIMTWIYNNTNRSVLSAVLLHFMFNFTFSYLQPAPGDIHLYGTALSIIMVIGIILSKGLENPDRLVRHQERD